MNSLKLTYSYLKFNKLNSLMIIILLAIGYAGVIVMIDLSKAFNEKLSADARAVDMVVGAKGSPLQLVLSTIYHSDIPTGNISYDDAEKVAKRNEIKKSLKIGLGDNYKNYRIVGTENNFTDFYGLTIAAGRSFEKPFEAVIGADVAANTGLKPGDSFSGAHGLTGMMDVHTQFPYKVVGIAERTGNITDRLIFTDLKSVWIIHAHPDADDHDEDAEEHLHGGEHASEDRGDVTAVLVKLKSPMAGFSLPRMINRQSNMLAANPAYESARLFQLINYGTDILKIFSSIMIIAGITMMALLLYNSLQQRSYDFAVIRILGGSRGFIFANILLEATMILLAGLVLAWVIATAVILILPYFEPQLSGFKLFSNLICQENIILLGAITSISLVISLIPAIQAYRYDITKKLNG